MSLHLLWLETPLITQGRFGKAAGMGSAEKVALSSRSVEDSKSASPAIASLALSCFLQPSGAANTAGLAGSPALYPQHQFPEMIASSALSAAEACRGFGKGVRGSEPGHAFPCLPIPASVHPIVPFSLAPPSYPHPRAPGEDPAPSECTRARSLRPPLLLPLLASGQKLRLQE